ncbi:MAG TPA: hypothetical protein VL101_09395 [Nordella sp.]|nr:hypothetical protein [Nordella sp.]
MITTDYEEIWVFDPSPPASPAGNAARPTSRPRPIRFWSTISEGLAHLSDSLFLIVTDRTKKDVEPTRFVLFKLTGAK